MVPRRAVIALIVLASCGCERVVSEKPTSPPSPDEGVGSRNWMSKMDRRVQELLDAAVARTRASGVLDKRITCLPGKQCRSVERARGRCAAGDGEACRDLAQALYLGEVVATNWAASTDILAAPCAEGDHEACLSFASQTDLVERSTAADREAVMSIYWRQCYGPEPRAWSCFGIARSLTNAASTVAPRSVAVSAVEHGCGLEPDWDWICCVARCLRADASATAMTCACDAE